MTIASDWRQIEMWLGRVAPQVTLPGGASADEIDRTEEAIGLRFPAELRESYLVHNGSGGVKIFEHGELLSLGSLVVVWELMRDMLAEPDTPPDSWDLAWIPFGDDALGDQLVIDTLPDPPHAAGSVVLWWHETNLVADIALGFGELLASRIEAIERGDCRFDSQSMSICCPGDGGEMARSRFRRPRCMRSRREA